MSRAFLREEDLQEDVKVRVLEQPRQITPDGYAAFEEELHRLQALEQSDPAVEQQILAILRKMSAMTVVHPRLDEQRAFFGAWVTLEDEDCVRRTYRLVGPDEVGFGPSWVSINSPVARILLGRSVGDIVPMQVPSGEPLSLEVVSVDWTLPEE